MPNSTERVRKLRKQRTEAGLREVRGIWLKPEDHETVKYWCSDLAASYTEKKVVKALGLDKKGE